MLNRAATRSPIQISRTGMTPLPKPGAQNQRYRPNRHTKTKRKNPMDPHTQRIRALNDEMRWKLTGGLAVMTPGIAALGPEAVESIVKTIAVFDDFCHANDSHEEHDFGSFQAEGETIFFKIDYFDRNLTYHSPDPADPAVTRRVITIMLASEY